MALRSMTGFARADGSGEGTRWTWEVRSVNGRGLDIRIRTPPGLEHVEQAVRDRVAERIARGNVQLTLSAKREAGEEKLSVNEEILDQVADAIDAIGQRFKVSAGSAEAILAIRGVVDASSPELDEPARRALGERVVASLDEALVELVDVRAREGAAIGQLLGARLDEIEHLVAAAEDTPGRTAEAIRARLSEQLAVLLENQNALDPARIHQEAVLLATRADIREELDRLAAHVAAAGELVSAGGPIGRRLDFLAQELNREVNTLCAKSNDLALTKIGLDMKSSIDQFREQVQNLE